MKLNKTESPATGVNLLTGSLLVTVLIALALIPFGISYYQNELFIIFFLNVILVSSYRLVTTTGDWGLCHIVLMGAGAYSTALMAKHAGLPFIVVLPLSGLATAGVGLLFVLPLLRTRGFAFFIASFAFGEFLRLIWVKVRNPFGGNHGIGSIPAPQIGDFQLDDPIVYYYTCLIVVLVSLFVLYRIDKSRIGNAWKSIHMNAELTECIGINVFRFRTSAFVIGAFFAGIAGSLMAYQLGSVDPRSFLLTEMVYLIIWVVVGGTTTFWGPIIGLAVMTIAFEWTRPLLEWRPMLFGGVLILFLILLPGGLDSLYPKLVSVWRKKQAAK